MPYLLVGGLLLAALAIWLTLGVLKLVLMLAMAGVVGVVADAVVPGKLPLGRFGAVLAGLLGSWLGILLPVPKGPVIFGIPVVAAFVGALILAGAWEIYGALQGRREGGGMRRSLP